MAKKFVTTSQFLQATVVTWPTHDHDDYIEGTVRSSKAIKDDST